MKPNFASPATMQMTPEKIANTPAIAIACRGSPLDNGSIVAEISGIRAESGPNTKIRLGPKMA